MGEQARRAREDRDGLHRADRDSRGRASPRRSASRRSSSAACPRPRRRRRAGRARARCAARSRRARRRARGSARRAGRPACAPDGRSRASSRRPRGSPARSRAGSRPRFASSSRAHSSEVPRITGPQPRIPAATAPCSESGSAASVIRAATFVGISPCSAIETSSRSRKKRCSSVGSSPVSSRWKYSVKRQPAHEVAGQVAPAHLDPVGIGLADPRLHARIFLPMHPLATTVVGSYPQPDWLIDREKLAGRLPPRVPAHELWRVDEAWLDEAQDDATRLAVRDMEEAGHRRRHGRRDPARELLELLRERARGARPRRARDGARPDRTSEPGAAGRGRDPARAARCRCATPSSCAR